MKYNLQPFPSSRGKRQISVNGGRSPRWRGDGKELFYIASDGKMMSAVLKVTTTGIDVESLRPLFDCPYIPFIPSSYDVTADGQRFLVLARSDHANSALSVLMNWRAPKEQ